MLFLFMLTSIFRESIWKQKVGEKTNLAETDVELMMNLSLLVWFDTWKVRRLNWVYKGLIGKQQKAFEKTPIPLTIEN